LTTFAELKKKQKEQFQKLNSKITELSNPQYSNDDDRFWQPSVDKMGNGYAVIRFLPAPVNEDDPFICMWDHGFKGPTGKWYIEKSLTTIKKKDPVSEFNSKLWATGEKKNKDIVSGTPGNGGTKRRTFFYSNIYVVDDPEHPENNGKVFLYRYGKKIFDKLNDLMNPKFPDEEPVNPFDLWSGANFKLKIAQKDGYRNYDRSEFAKPGPVADDDEMEEIWKKEYSLQEFLNPENFKSYEELQARLNEVMGFTSEDDEEAPKTTKAKTPKKEVAVEDNDEDPPFEVDTDSGDDDEDFFKTLIKKK